MVEPHSSNFRVITTNFLGVRIFQKFTVLVCKYKQNYIFVLLGKGYIFILDIYCCCFIDMYTF